MHYESMKPVNYKEQTEAEWGTLETTAEGFFCIEIECEEWNIATLMKDYYYDPMEDKFIHETLGIEFDQKLAPEPVEDTTPIQNLVECAKSIDPNWSQTEHDALWSSYIHNMQESSRKLGFMRSISIVNLKTQNTWASFYRHYYIRIMVGFGKLGRSSHKILGIYCLLRIYLSKLIRLDEETMVTDVISSIGVGKNYSNLTCMVHI